MYKLTGTDGKIYCSEKKGSFGGHKGLKIYGRLDCPSALRYIRKGQYASHRVFFKDETTALAAGYRPCGICMKEHYQLWKEGRLMTHALSVTPVLNEDFICSVRLADGSEKYLPAGKLKIPGIRERLQNGLEYYSMEISGDDCILVLSDEEFQWGYTAVWDYVKDRIIYLRDTPYAVRSMVFNDQVVDMYLVQYWEHPADLWYSAEPLGLIDPETGPDKLPLHIPVDASVTKETDCRILEGKDSLIFQAGKNEEVLRAEDL